MRAILAVAITATFVLVFGPWWNYSTVADAGPNVAKSIDTTALTLKAVDMPTHQLVAGSHTRHLREGRNRAYVPQSGFYGSTYTSREALIHAN